MAEQNGTEQGPSAPAPIPNPVDALWEKLKEGEPVFLTEGDGMKVMIVLEDIPNAGPAYRLYPRLYFGSSLMGKYLYRATVEPYISGHYSYENHARAMIAAVLAGENLYQTRCGRVIRSERIPSVSARG